MRVTIIDRHTLFVDALALVLEGEGFIVRKIDTWHPEASIATILAKGLASAPHLVLLGESLGRHGDGTRLVSPLAAAGATVVLLVETDDSARWGLALQHGARGVLHKACCVHDALALVTRVRDGLSLISPDERQRLIQAAAEHQDELRTITERLARLTRCEREVLAALMDGAEAREIARANVVAEATVRGQIKSILSKLEVSSQISAVGAAHKVGWHLPEQ